MKKVLMVIVALGLISQSAQAVVIEDDFSDPNGFNTAIWEGSGGAGHSAANENMFIDNFGASFSRHSDAGGLINSTVGYASMTVASAGPTFSFGGNFQISNTLPANTANSLVRVSFGNEASFEYDFDPNAVTLLEIVWNNSLDPNAQPFETDSGWVGTISGNSAVTIIDGDPMTARWRMPANASGISQGDAADRFGFWVGNAGGRTVIDDFKIRDSLVPVAGPTSADFDGSGIVDGLDFLQWQEGDTPEGGSPAELALWETQYGGPPPLSAVIGAVPEPTALALAIPTLLGTLLRRRRRV